MQILDLKSFNPSSIHFGYSLTIPCEDSLGFFFNDSILEESPREGHHISSATLLQNIFSADVPIQQAPMDALEISDPVFLNLLLTAFSTSVANQVRFNFNGEEYLLSQEESNSTDLVLKNNTGKEIVKLENTSLEKLRSRVILLNLFKQLAPNTKAQFLALFNIEKVSRVTNHSPIVSGDLDGSSSRQIVLGIQTGIINTDLEGIVLLAELMDAEATILDHGKTLLSGHIDYCAAHKMLKKIQLAAIALTNIDVQLPSEVLDMITTSTDDIVNKFHSLGGWSLPLLFAEFQTNKALQLKMEELVQYLSYQKGHTPFISIGDGAHDRFSNNKDVDREIREKMHAEGAIFITGNHDVFFTKDFNDINDEDKMQFSFSFGCFAKDTATASEWEAHQKKVLTNAYYDQVANTLYLHHGLGSCQTEAGTLEISSAFGDFSVQISGPKFDLVLLTETINKQSLPRPDSVFQEYKIQAKVQNAYEFNEFTGFRPNEEEMTVAARVLHVRIVHGHNGDKNTLSADVVALNSREHNQRRLAIVAAHVGEKVSVATNLENFVTKRKVSLVTDESIDERSVRQKR